MDRFHTKPGMVICRGDKLLAEVFGKTDSSVMNGKQKIKVLTQGGKVILENRND